MKDIFPNLRRKQKKYYILMYIHLKIVWIYDQTFLFRSFMQIFKIMISFFKNFNNIQYMSKKKIPEKSNSNIINDSKIEDKDPVKIESKPLENFKFENKNVDNINTESESLKVLGELMLQLIIDTLSSFDNKKQAKLLSIIQSFDNEIKNQKIKKNFDLFMSYFSVFSSFLIIEKNDKFKEEILEKIKANSDNIEKFSSNFEKYNEIFEKNSDQTIDISNSIENINKKIDQIDVSVNSFNDLFKEFQKEFTNVNNTLISVQENFKKFEEVNVNVTKLMETSANIDATFKSFLERMNNLNETLNSGINNIDLFSSKLGNYIKQNDNLSDNISQTNDKFLEFSRKFEEIRSLLGNLLDDSNKLREYLSKYAEDIIEKIKTDMNTASIEQISKNFTVIRDNLKNTNQIIEEKFQETKTLLNKIEEIKNQFEK